MLDRPRRWLVSYLIAGVATAMTPISAGAQHGSGDSNQVSNENVTEAQVRFQRGVELYLEEDYAAALVEFRRAYGAAPRFQVLYNIGACYLALKDYARAERAFQRFLHDGNKTVDAKTAKSVRADLRMLRGRTARLHIDVEPVGALISIDDEPVGESPLGAPILVNVGRRRLLLSHPDYEPVTRLIEVAGGETQRIEVALRKRVEPLPRVPSSVPSAALTAVPTRTNTPLVISLSLTGALAAAATVTGVLALQADQRRDDALASVPADRSTIDREGDLVRSLGIATDALIGSAILAGVFSLYFALTDDDPPRNASDAAQNAIGVGAQGRRVWIGARF